MSSKPIKHIPKTNEPIGWQKRDRKKIEDPVTGKPIWVRANKGLLLDNNGKETQIDSTKKYAKPGRKHHVRFGNTRKTHPPVPKEPTSDE